MGTGQSLAAALRAGAFVVGQAVPIAVRKFNGQQRFVVTTTVLLATPTLLVLRGAVGRRFVTAAGVTHLATASIEYFPVGRWYNLLSFFQPQGGALERHFCNLLLDVTWDGQMLHYVDLDLDLIVTPDGHASVEDLADFRTNARQWHYPAVVRRQTLAALRELRLLAAQQQAPFTSVPLDVALAQVPALAQPGGLWSREDAQ